MTASRRWMRASYGRATAVAGIVAGLVAGAATTLVPAAEWSQFRGPSGDGRSDASGLPIQWSPSENVLWKVPVPGSGWSSPVVHKDRIYLTAAVPVPNPEAEAKAAEEAKAAAEAERKAAEEAEAAAKKAAAEGKEKPPEPRRGRGQGKPKSPQGDLSLRTLCYSAVDGKLIWDEEVFLQVGADAPRIHDKNSHASPTPIIEGDRIYVHFGHQGTACLDLSGKPVWRNNSIHYKPVHGNGGSPILVDDLLIFSVDGGEQRFVIALDKASGETRWKTERPGSPPKKFSFSTPTLIECGGRRQVVSPGSDCVSAYDPATGREIWTCRYTGYSVIAKPVFGHDMVYISTSYDSPVAMAIKADGQGDVTDTRVAWQTKRAAPNTPSMLLDGDELYMISDRGIATCLDAKTGEQRWQERIGGNFSASPILAEGRIVLLSEEGVATIVKAGKTFEKIGECKIEERTLASLGVYQKSLLLRSDQHLYRIGVR